MDDATASAAAAAAPPAGATGYGWERSRLAAVWPLGAADDGLWMCGWWMNSKCNGASRRAIALFFGGAHRWFFRSWKLATPRPAFAHVRRHPSEPSRRRRAHDVRAPGAGYNHDNKSKLFHIVFHSWNCMVRGQKNLWYNTQHTMRTQPSSIPLPPLHPSALRSPYWHEFLILNYKIYGYCS